MCPLEDVAVVLGWTTSQKLIAHYWPTDAEPNYESASPPGPFFRFDAESTRRRLQEHWDELREFSESRHLQSRAGDVERQLREHFMARLEED